MLNCVNEHNKTLHASTCDEVATRQLSKDNKLFCPFCKSNVSYRNGDIVKAYFAHKNIIDCPSYGAEESEDHEKGKQIIYEWLKNQYPDAFIEYEYHITATNQLADVYIEHKHGNLKGLKWAFEFQHSSITLGSWKKRHELYEKAGIQDFWVLDKAIFFKLSEAKEVIGTGARRRDGFDCSIFKETNLCYLLDLKTGVMTIDFKFRKSTKTRRVRGIERKNEYFYHNPSQHSCHIDRVRVKVNDEFKYGVLMFDAIEEQMKPTLSLIISGFRRKLEAELERQLQEQAKIKKAYIKANYESEDAENIWQFMIKNREIIKDDVRTLPESSFFKKYSNYIDKVISNCKELESLEESNELVKKSLKGFVFHADPYKISFLNKQGDNSLEEHLKLEHKEKIALIEYAYNNHREVLEKLASIFNQKRVKDKLKLINFSLVVYKTNPTAMDYALEYRRFESTKEIDEYIEQIREEIIDYDPSKDFDLW
mgnify:CR=1 FL=1